MKPFRHDLVKLLFGLAVCLLPLSAPVSGFAEEDSALFMAGFSAYQRKEYHDAAQRLKRLLEVYPETPLRDMTLFFLARAQFKAGNRPEAGRVMSRLLREYPGSTLKEKAEPELMRLAAAYWKNEKTDGGPETGRAGAQERAERERFTSEKAEQARLAAEAGVSAAAEPLFPAPDWPWVNAGSPRADFYRSH
ncbi:MAG TPA: tetratricopeptide repeat protein [Geobacteraceae bacterium]